MSFTHSNWNLCVWTTLVVVAPALTTTVQTQPKEFNYAEAKVPKFTLPDPLITNNGKRVSDAATWYKQRRPEIVKLFQTHVYGRSPGRPAQMSFEVTAVDKPVMKGMGYHIHTGRHDVTDFDWQQYLKFADMHFRK